MIAPFPAITPPARGVTVRIRPDRARHFASAPFRTRAHHRSHYGARASLARIAPTRGAFLANCFRFGDETYLDPGNGLGRYLNHSCSPNAGIRKRSDKLFSSPRAHQAGRGNRHRLLHTIGDDDIYRMRCHCGARRCRQWVGRFGLLPKSVKDDYFKRGLVPDFLPACTRLAIIRQRVGGERRRSGEVAREQLDLDARRRKHLYRHSPYSAPGALESPLPVERVDSSPALSPASPC